MDMDNNKDQKIKICCKICGYCFEIKEDWRNICNKCWYRT